MRFIHVADIHASRERLPQTLSILNTLTERAKQGDIDFILFAGDFWDSTITATKGSGFSDIVNKVRFLSKWTYLYFIYGTPSHEPSGSLDAFRFDNTYVFDQNEIVYIGGSLAENKCKTKLICIPEPRRSNYITSSASETDNLINKEIKTFLKEEIAKPVSFLKGVPKSIVTAEQTIVIYHGEVKGAVYQNGVSASSPTAISKKLLQSLNADYYAFGHIHQPQEVFPNAWYSGSACPKNFGETHDGHYNLVTIDNGETKVEEVSFCFPMYETYYVKRADNRSLETLLHFHKNYTNKHLRVVFDCTKEERRLLNIKQEQEDTKKRTNAVSVKLEPNIIEGEAIAKSEIVKRKSIVEKMIEYAKEKSFAIPKFSKELLQDIQDNSLSKLAYPQHSFELLSLSLRGAIGIRNGQHKDDFELNFENLEDGVVCLIGENGHGKTTLIENCHPYPCMLSRDGTLKEHFCLKDSHRILIYKDENGLYYKISMLIDGKTSTGKTSYFVETSKDRETWNSIPEVDGSFKAYEEWVNNTFGSIDVFLRTAFFAKEQTKDAVDISDTTKGERMELLSKLAGTEHLKGVSVIAREQRKEVEKSAGKLSTEIESYTRHEAIIEKNNTDIETWNKEKTIHELAVSDIEKKVSELRLKDAEYQKAKAVTEANNALRIQYEKELKTKKAELETFSVVEKDIFDKVKEYHENVIKNTELIELKEKELSVKRDALYKAVQEVSAVKDDISKVETSLGKIESNMKYLKTQIKSVDDVCPTCGAKLSEHKKEELFSLVNENKKALAENTSEKKKLMEQLRDLNTRKQEIDVVENINAEIKIISDVIQKTTEIIKACEAYLDNLPEVYTKYTYEEAVKKTSGLESECTELNEKINSLVCDNNIEDVSYDLKENEFLLKKKSNIVTELSANIKAAEKENARCKSELDLAKDKREELRVLQDKITAYNFIEEAFSNKGIPVIELRESAPEIADIANKILKDSYGNKFEIRFGSTCELKTKRKEDEDFNIIVYDTENGDEKTIDLVSSGERIWIKQALFYAFSIVQMNRTGFNFRTRLIDESDGSLDGGLRPKYLNMVTAAHEQASARLTILITHSQEIKDIAQQIIEI